MSDIPGRKLADYINHPAREPQKIDDLVILAFVRLAEHEYWPRLWIVQEMQLAKEAEIWWEGHSIALTRLATFVNQLTARGTTHLFQRWSAIKT